MLFSFNSSLLFRCFCMFQWLGSELCLEFFILYYTVHAILYSTARSAWGSGPRILYFQHCNICSCWEACLPWNDGLSLNTFSVSYWCHMTVFLLYFGYTSWRVRAASIRFTTLLCLLSPPCPYLGYQNVAELTGCDQDCLVRSIWCSIGEVIGGASVLGFPVSSLSDFCGFSICSLWHFRLWTSELSTNLLETRATSVSVMTFSEPKWPYHVIHWLQDCCSLHQRSRGLKE